MQVATYTIELIVRAVDGVELPSTLAFDIAEALPKEWWLSTEETGEIEVAQMAHVSREVLTS